MELEEAIEYLKDLQEERKSFIEDEKDLGMECDKKDWKRLLDKINEVLEV